MKKKLPLIETYDDRTILRPVSITYCEHCGKVRKQMGYQDVGVTWCVMCADTLGDAIKSFLDIK